MKELEAEIEEADFNSGVINKIELEIDNQFQRFSDICANSTLSFMQDALTDLQIIIDLFRAKFNSTDEQSKKWVLYALNYFIKTYDIIPDRSSDYGYADDAIIFKIVLSKVRSSKESPRDSYIIIKMDDNYIRKGFATFCKNENRNINFIRKKFDFKKNNFFKSCEKSKFSFMKEAQNDLEELTKINDERFDTLDKKAREWLIFALYYFNLAADYIPDYLKQVGYADDAIILKVALQKVKKEVTHD